MTGGRLVHVTAILGRTSDPAFADRPVDPVSIASADAAKRRLRRASVAGVEVAIDLPRGSYLADGAVLADLDHEGLIAVERTPEEVVVIRFDRELDRWSLAEAAARIGHAFGNQHVSLDVRVGELLVPIATSAEIVLATVEALGLTGVEARVGRAKLACERPLAVGHAHGSGHEVPAAIRVRRG